MINSIEDLKDRYGYRKADCCGNCANGYINNFYNYRCTLNKKNNMDTISIEVSREGYCTAYERKK